MKKIYYLSTCDTCKRIMNELELPSDFVKQDIKTHPLTPEDLEELHGLSNSYEALFNKRARLYRARNLHTKELDEKAYANLLLEHYTFLKRPVIVYEGLIFIGNSKKNIAEALAAIHP